MSIVTALRGFGAHKIINLKSKSLTEEYIPYLDLIQDSTGEILPSAVAEFQEKPVLYVIDHSTLSSNSEQRKNELEKVRRILACRGDAQYFAVLEPGQLEVFSVGFGKLPQSLTKKLDEEDACFVIPSIALSKLLIEKDVTEERIHELLFNLMNDATKKLKRRVGLENPLDALSLTGRAIFLRFLMDRDIINEENLKDVCLGAQNRGDCFSDSSKWIAINKWLDSEFNGDLFQLSEPNYSKFLQKIEPSKRQGLFDILTAVLKKAEPIADGYQTRLIWDYLDFSHIPVGVLSQVYERFCHEYDPYAKEISIHYTPRNIAEYMVDEVFSDLDECHEVKILDPAAGAGIFLVLCFQKLVANHWKKNKKRPDRNTIRKILYNQLKGFDINDPALTLAAFSLYLTAIELDSSSKNLNGNMKFEKLRGNVLFDMRSPSDKDNGTILGSLSFDNNGEHFGVYDIVIGNPPWTKLKGSGKDKQKEKHLKKLAIQFNQIIQEVAKERGVENYGKINNPFNVYDLPFVWRATQWCKVNGRIAFALHSRLLFNDSWKDARRVLFSSLKITGVLNGSALRHTKVWPDSDAPFCLLFAQNTKPNQDSCFTFITPEVEEEMNREGRFNIDYISAQPMQSYYLADKPELLKTLSKGTTIDISLIQKIAKGDKISIWDYWNKSDPKLEQGSGYKVYTRNKPATHLRDYPHLMPNNLSENQFIINTDVLPKFGPDMWLEAPRNKELYSGPMVIFRKFPRANTEQARALLCFNNVVFNQYFYGYSAKGHHEKEALVKYIFLILNSELFLYYTLMLSGSFGVEREQIIKKDVDKFPIVPFERLDKKHIIKINDLIDGFIKEEFINWSSLNELINEIYGLNNFDREAIKDALAISLPFSASIERAQKRSTKTEIETYAKRIEKELKPFYKVIGKPFYVNVLQSKTDMDPWIFLELRTTLRHEGDAPMWPDMPKVMKIADKSGASRIIINPGEDPFLIGIYAQYRYWTPTRARLTSIELLHDGKLS